MPGLCPAVSADEEVVSGLGRDQADVFRLRLGALANAAGHRALDLVRRADAAVALLDADSEPDRILDPVAAPRGADAALDRAQRLAIGVPALEARLDQLLPDGRQLVHLRSEQVDPLAARDLRVQAVLLGHRAEGDQLGGSDLATGHARHDAVEAAALHVRQKPVVGVLERVVGGIGDALVPKRCEDRGHGWLADLAAVSLPVIPDELFEGPDPLDLDDFEQVLAGVLEMLAEALPHRLARGLELGVQQAGHHRDASAAARPGRRVFLNGSDRRQIVLADRRADRPLCDVIAEADLRVVPDAAGNVGLSFAANARKARGFERQIFVGLGQGRQLGVSGGIANQHASDQPFPVGAEEQLLVHAGERVVHHERNSGFGRCLVVAEAGNVDAHQLQLRRELGALEAHIPARQAACRYVGHLPAWRDQTVDCAVVQGGFADRVDVWIGGSQLVVDGDAATRPDFQSAVPGQLVARPDPGGDNDHVHVETPTARELHSGDAAVAQHALGGLVQVHADS